MSVEPFEGFDPGSVPSPCYVISLGKLRANAGILGRVRDETGARVLLALKGYAAFSTFPLLKERLDGVCASGAFEARLGREEFGGEVHTYSPAFKPEDLKETLDLSDHVSFNSMDQWKNYRDRVLDSGVRAGLRMTGVRRILSWSFISPSRSASGRGGQPAM